MRNERVKSGFLGLALICLLAAPSTAHAQLQCVLDYNGDGVASTLDFPLFVAAYTAGSGLADLNGDGLVDPFDVNTATAYYGFSVCPAFADYQYNRSIDAVDLFFFNFLFGIGSLRADVNGDGAVNVIDQTVMSGAYGATY